MATKGSGLSALPLKVMVMVMSNFKAEVQRQETKKKRRSGIFLSPKGKGNVSWELARKHP